MSMVHKAFLFDYEAFERELKGILERSLASGVNEELVRFIHDHRSQLTDPYEERPLPASWEESVSPKDAHQYGYVALTKFYDLTGPQSEIGLWYDWEPIYDVLEQESKGLESAILGRAVGPPSNFFDPGKMGTYFQSADLVEHNLARLRALIQKKPELEEELSPAIEMLERAASQEKGLYVRF